MYLPNELCSSFIWKLSDLAIAQKLEERLFGKRSNRPDDDTQDNWIKGKGALGKNGGRRRSALHNGSSISYTTEVIAQVLADVQQDDVYSLTISQATSRVYEESSSQAPKARVQPFCKSPIDTVAHSGDERHYIHTSSFHLWLCAAEENMRAAALFHCFTHSFPGKVGFCVGVCCWCFLFFGSWLGCVVFGFSVFRPIQ